MPTLTRGGLALLLALSTFGALPREAPAQTGAGKSAAFGDPLPAGAIGRLGTTRLRHPGWIESFCFSPDGNHLASVSFDYLCLWDAQTGKLLRSQEAKRERYQAIAYSPDGKLLAVGIGGPSAPIVICDAQSFKELRRLDNAHARDGVRHLVFSPDSKTLFSSGYDEQLRLWDPHTGKLKEDIQTHATRVVGAFALSRDGRLLAWSTEVGDIHIRDLAAGKPLRGLCGHRVYVAALAFSPDGASLASASGEHYDSTFRMWDVATGQERWRFQGDEVSCASVAFSKDGKTLFAVETDIVHFLDPVTGKEISRLTGYSNNQSSVVLSGDGKTLAVSRSHAIHLFDRTGKPRWDSPAHDGSVKALAFAPDGKTLFTGGDDSLLRIWDPWAGKLQRTITGHAVGSHPGSANLHRRNTGNADAISGVALNGDGRLLASLGDAWATYLWDAATGKKILTVDRHNSNGGHGIAFSPDGKAMVCAGHWNDVEFFDVRTGKVTFLGTRKGELPKLVRGLWVTPRSHDGDIHAVAYSPDGKLVASGGKDRTVRIWDAATGFQVHKLAEHPGEVHAVAFSPNGQLVAAGTEKSVWLWHVAAGKRLVTLDEPSRRVCAVAFSPDGRLLAAGGSNRTVQVWEVITGRAIRRFDGHQASVTALAFAPDSKHVASGSFDSTVVMWNAYDSKAKPLDAKEREVLWARLALEDAAIAHEAMQWLIASPQPSVAWIKDHLRPADASSVQEIAQWIAQLDSASFAKRDQAARALQESGPSGAFALRQALEKSPPLEVRRRIEQLLAQPQFIVKSPDERRALRAVAVLEQIGTTEALTLLQAIAKGEPLARMTHEAENAGKRITRRLAKVE